MLVVDRARQCIYVRRNDRNETGEGGEQKKLVASLYVLPGISYYSAAWPLTMVGDGQEREGKCHGGFMSNTAVH